jgi:hypothetical protein
MCGMILHPACVPFSYQKYARKNVRKGFLEMNFKVWDSLTKVSLLQAFLM